MDRLKLIYKLPVTVFLLCLYGVCVTFEVVFRACSDLLYTRNLQLSAHEYFEIAVMRYRDNRNR